MSADFPAVAQTHILNGKGPLLVLILLCIRILVAKKNPLWLLSRVTWTARCLATHLEESDRDVQAFGGLPENQTSVGVTDSRLPLVGLNTRGQRRKVNSVLDLEWRKDEKAKVVFVLSLLLYNLFEQVSHLGHMTSVSPRPHHPQFVRVPKITPTTLFTSCHHWSQRADVSLFACCSFHS